MYCETVIQSIEAENTNTNSLTILNKDGKAGKTARGSLGPNGTSINATSHSLDKLLCSVLTPHNCHFRPF